MPIPDIQDRSDNPARSRNRQPGYCPFGLHDRELRAIPFADKSFLDQTDVNMAITVKCELDLFVTDPFLFMRIPGEHLAV